MLCQNCHEREATVHVTKIINNQKQEIHLCEQCAKKSDDINFDFDTTFTINNFLTGLLDSIHSSPFKVDYIKTTTCSKCGMSYGKFKQLGRLGCFECYKTFNEKLLPLIKRIHGSETHIGKIPKKAGSRIRLKHEIMSLKKQLQMAVEKEEFEKAAKLRDRIKELEKDFGIQE
ncbi:Protein-arginine kinase activator protein McsA [Caminicella sporogenes DSM 14501]|uniref:Protein-arginine kinase activator protein McsA n=1 Tax=Caminicella sporogenes DSM 14501 TaxID=1121266 RepID=A0A1M6SS73_9FIRM|nr:UvrB/UvrC motif-containing protein [Caminicella sporogenes]RKD26407.1 hypothetical protein BET04_10615 [Caminicella sporogenes]WIF95631.1 UvrB/UvrC motif-containing protein [Caminicella sporogenes]SHK47574.1 Protein-arginine kinase activator protein McsA [Caminicella sporogenes DSM 14501]